MTFTVEVLLKETEGVVSETVTLGHADPDQWTDDDVDGVLRIMLQAMARAKDPDAVDPDVVLRGLSWIVDTVDQGVMIAIEVPSGAVVAGPFAIAQEQLDAMLGRVLSSSATSSTVVH